MVGKKIAGILVRSDIEENSAYVQIGIGINVNTIPQEYSNTSTSILANLISQQ